MNIYLVGYRCCGKSSVGRLLAGRLDWPFVDTDLLVQAQTGLEIAAIVKTRGWEYFRQLEQACLASVADRRNQVVATGGGVVLDAQNVAAMKGSGIVVWLKATADVIRQRMRHDLQTDPQRPALTHGDAHAEIESVLAERTPLYRAAADIELDTDRKPVYALVEELVVQLKPYKLAVQAGPGTAPAS